MEKALYLFDRRVWGVTFSTDIPDMGPEKTERSGPVLEFGSSMRKDLRTGEAFGLVLILPSN